MEGHKMRLAEVTVTISKAQKRLRESEQDKRKAAFASEAASRLFYMEAGKYTSLAKCSELALTALAAETRAQELKEFEASLHEEIKKLKADQEELCDKIEKEQQE